MSSSCPDPSPACTGRGQPGGLGWALVVLSRAHRRAAERELHDLPGGARAFRLLSAVREGSPNQLALAHASGLDRTVVTYLLDDLEEAGLVERQADPLDRRARRIVLTDDGACRLTGLDRRLDLLEDNLLAGLGPGEATDLRRLLRIAASGVQGQEDPTCVGPDPAARPDG